jgi:hypothetical protein
MINETKFLLNSIPDWKVGHIKRSGNVATHELAKFGLWRTTYGGMLTLSAFMKRFMEIY